MITGEVIKEWTGELFFNEEQWLQLYGHVLPWKTRSELFKNLGTWDHEGLYFFCKKFAKQYCSQLLQQTLLNILDYYQ